jgi:hypothetical protein
MAAIMENLREMKEAGVNIVDLRDGSRAVELRIQPGYAKKRSAYVLLTPKEAVRLASHLLSHAARLMKDDRSAE